jgi:hypothetical protein
MYIPNNISAKPIPRHNQISDMRISDLVGDRFDGQAGLGATPILRHWSETPPEDPFPNHEAGTWGPTSADKLTESVGARWRRLGQAPCRRVPATGVYHRPILTGAH